jgi:hypothetical protein
LPDVLPTSTDLPFSSSSSSPIEILERALHEVEEITPASSKRKVRFELSQTQIIPTELPHGLTDEDIENAWSTPKDWEDSITIYHNEVIACQRNHEEFIRDLVHVVSLCYQSSSDSLGDDDMERAQSLIPMIARGMEADIAPMLKTSRRKHSEAVMEYVHKIPKQLPSDLRERMLSARSMQYSRPHKVLARVLGQADATALEQ